MTQSIYYGDKCIAITDSNFVPRSNEEIEIDGIRYCVDNIRYRTLLINEGINSHVITGVDIKVDKLGRLF